MSTPQDPDTDPSTRVKIDEFEEIEAQLQDGTPLISAQEQLVEVFLR